MLIIFLLSLALTLAVELSFALLWGLRGRDLLLCALVNLLTNPAVVLLHQLFPRPAATAVFECVACAAEGWYYSRYGRHIRAPWLFSLLCNGLSFSFGLLINVYC